MKSSTALKLVAKMRAGLPVKLRKSRVGGISSPTWCMICNVLFDEGINSVKYLYREGYDNSIIAYYYDAEENETVLSNNIILY
jgi:hypothetical protein